MPLELITGPLVEPISLVELKNALRLDATEDDLLLTSLITAARIYIETSTGTIMINQSWAFFINKSARDQQQRSPVVNLPLSPLQSVDDVLIYQDGTGTALPGESYQIDPSSKCPRLIFTSALSLSNNSTGLSNRGLNNIEIRMTVGHGAAADDVPEDLRQAVLLLASHWYEQRSPIGPGGSFDDVPPAVHSLMANHKQWRLQ